MNETRLVAKQLQQKSEDSRLIKEARRALIDYLGCVLQARKEPKVQEFGRLWQQEGGKVNSLLGLHATPERAALINGFAAHYLDFDDVQANFRGHPSAVIYSALLAIAPPSSQVRQVLQAFIAGVELAGKLGLALNPDHTVQGWHSTATIGTIAATGALCNLANASVDQTTRALSFATSQASGMSFQNGTDAKPLQAGLAARNAVTAFILSQSRGSFTANEDSLQFWGATLGFNETSFSLLGNDWYQPGQINKPGLWFKVHPFCSAALSGYEAAKMLWNKGVRWSDCVQVVVHYPPNGDRALNQQWPQTGQESKFSIEFIIWQVLKFGDVKDADFTARFVDSQFKIDVAKIVRKHDLATTSATKRPTLVETVTRRGIVKQLVVMPLGSPNRPLSSEKLQEKLLMVLPKEKVAALVDLIVKKEAVLQEIYWLIQ